LSRDTDDTLLATDFASFESVISSGDLYRLLIADSRAAGVVLPDESDEEARDKVKLLLMRDVLAKKVRYPSPFEDVFRRAFPSVHRFVCWINQDDHGELIRTLQRLESAVVIENVAPRLVDRFPIVTLHDAIYARTGDQPAVEDCFTETFEELGLELRVKVESTPIAEATAASRHRRIGEKNCGGPLTPMPTLCYKAHHEQEQQTACLGPAAADNRRKRCAVLGAGT
jgi:hypothetical protein